MAHDQHTKIRKSQMRNLEMRNLDVGNTPEELADEDAQQVVGGFVEHEPILYSRLVPTTGDPSLQYDFTDVMVESLVAK